MPKDETNTFFQEENKAAATKDNSSPENMGKWIGVAEKTINLFQNIMDMRASKVGNKGGGGETSAYEKGYAYGLNSAPTPQPAPAQAPQPIKIDYKTTEATEYLMNSLKKMNQEQTIGEAVKDLKEAQESGIMNGMIEQFLKNYVEVSQ